MKKTSGMTQDTRAIFFKNIKREEDIDDFAFKMWKSELQKELPSFWESMRELHYIKDKNYL